MTALVIVIGFITVLCSAGAMVTSIINGREMRAESERKSVKLEEIHKLVNSRLSETLKELATLRAYVADISKAPADIALAAKAAKDAK